jgi:hypothetical protein
MDALHVVKVIGTILGAWTALSVPAGVLLGAWLRDRGLPLEPHGATDAPAHLVKAA